MLYNPNDIEEYNDIIEADRIEVFHAKWCGAALLQVPQFEQLSKNLNTQIILMDIDKFTGFANVEKILSVPTTLLFKNDIVVHRLIGYQPLDRLLIESEKVFVSDSE